MLVALISAVWIILILIVSIYCLRKQNTELSERLDEYYDQELLYGHLKCTYDHSKLKLYGKPCPVCGLVAGSDMK